MRRRSRWVAVWMFMFGLEASVAGATRPKWLMEFTQALDPASPAARIVAQAKPDSLVHALARYFRQHQPPNAPWILGRPLETSKLQGLEAADAAVKHIISEYGTQQFGDTLPWFDPTKRVGTIARFPHFHPLAQAYLATRDEKYARAMVRDMLDFVRHVPIEKARGYTPSDEYHSNPWNWVLLQWRIARWIDALWVLRDSPSLSDSATLQILNHLWKEVDWLTPRIDLGLLNGTLGNLRSVLYAAAAFPDARHARYWREEGTRQFVCFVSHYFYPGEVSVELTLGYSSSVLGQCLMIVDKLPRGFLPEFLLTKLEANLDGHVGLMKPDRSLPRFGDHGNYDVRKSLLEVGARVFDRPDLAALQKDEPSADSLARFQSFPPNSRILYRDGYYAMRNGWSRTDQFFFMDAGPFGTNHQHADRLSFCVSADGADFIVDPGTAIYRSTKPGPRFDLRYGFLHNVVTVDGVDPVRGWMGDYLPGPRRNHWTTTDTYDFLEANYHYQPEGLDVTWWRSVFYKKGSYWLLMDWLKGRGRHVLESNMQCAMGDEVTAGDSGIVIVAPNGAKLAVLSAERDLAPVIVFGDTTFPGSRYPYGVPAVDWRRGGRGWVGTFGLSSPRDASRCYPSPAVVWTGEVRLPYLATYLFVPTREKRFSQKPRLTTCVTTPDSVIIEVPVAEDTTDWFGWCAPRGPETTRHRPFSRSFWLRMVAGKLRSLVLLNRQTLRLTTRAGILQVAFSAKVDATFRVARSRWTVRLDRAPHGRATLLRFVWQGPGRVEWCEGEGRGLVLTVGQPEPLVFH